MIKLIVLFVHKFMNEKKVLQGESIKNYTLLKCPAVFQCSNMKNIFWHKLFDSSSCVFWYQFYQIICHALQHVREITKSGKTGLEPTD